MKIKSKKENKYFKWKKEEKKNEKKNTLFELNSMNEKEGQRNGICVLVYKFVMV